VIQLEKKEKKLLGIFSKLIFYIVNVFSVEEFGGWQIK